MPDGDRITRRAGTRRNSSRRVPLDGVRGERKREAHRSGESGQPAGDIDTARRQHLLRPCDHLGRSHGVETRAAPTAIGGTPRSTAIPVVHDSCRLSVRPDTARLGRAIHADDRGAERGSDMDRSGVRCEMEQGAVEERDRFGKCRLPGQVDRRPGRTVRNLRIRTAIRTDSHEHYGADGAECVDDHRPRRRRPSLPPLHGRRVDDDRPHVCVEAMSGEQRSDAVARLLPNRQIEGDVLRTRAKARRDVQILVHGVRRSLRSGTPYDTRCDPSR